MNEHCSPTAHIQSRYVILQVRNHNVHAINTLSPNGDQETEIVERIAWLKISNQKVWKEIDNYASAAIRPALRSNSKKKMAKQLPNLLHFICLTKSGSVVKNKVDQ